MNMRLIMLKLALVATMLAATAASAQAQAVVNGLIVQLRDAPSHVTLAREQAQSRGGAAALGARESGRWQGVLGRLRNDAALLRDVPALAQAARRDPVGASAQVLRFARPLTTEQATRVAVRLAALPEVAWVEPNVREQRQALASGPPSDPYFSGPTGQWWLQLLQGSNDHAIEARLRGVPNFLTAWTSGTTGEASAVVAVLDTGITCHPELGNMSANCLGGAILPGYDFVADWDPVANVGYANDGDGRDSDPQDPGDWVSQADRNADATRYSGCTIEASSWHGTVIAGLLAALTDNNAGVAAMNWNGRVLPVRVAGKCGADVADIIDGMRWAAGLPVCRTSNGLGGCTAFVPANPNPARIINISFGSDAACGAAYQGVIDDLRRAPFPGGGVGAVVVAAAGNTWGAPSRPASCSGAIGVGALNRDGFKSNYSNFGAALAISTVGGDDNDGAWGALLADSGVLSIGNGGVEGPGTEGYYYHWGTSFSAPIVSGAASLMLSLNPALSADEIVLGLKRSARPHVTSTVPGFGYCSNANPGRCLCTAFTCGAGILDVDQALRYAGNPGAYVNTRAADVIDTLELRDAVALGPDRPANPVPPPPAPSGGGGGAMSGAWLAALALAAWALRRAKAPLRAPRSAPGKA